MNNLILFFGIFFTRALFATILFSQFLADSQEKKVAQIIKNKPNHYHEISLNLGSERELPERLKEVPNLTDLRIRGSAVHKIKNWSLLSELPCLNKLYFHEECELKKVPPALAQLTHIRLFSFFGNPVRYLPKDFVQLLKNNKKIKVDLRKTRFAYENTNKGGKGYHCLKNLPKIIFPRRLSMFGSESIFPVKMASEINEFLLFLRKNNLCYVDSQKIRACQGEPFEPNNTWDGERFMWEFETLLSSFELDDKNAPNYLDFEHFRNSIEELEPWVKNSSLDNNSLIKKTLFPRLRGFGKQLFGMPIDKSRNEQRGAQPHPWDKDIVQGVLSSAIKMLNAEKDPTQKTALFIPFEGLLHCVEGYIEGLNSIIFRDKNFCLDEADLETFVRRIITSLKRQGFLSAAIDGDFFQSAHQASYYLYYLGSTLGLETCAPGYQEISSDQIRYDLITRGIKPPSFESQFADNYYGSGPLDPCMGESNPVGPNRVEFADSKDNFLDNVLKEFFLNRFHPLYLARQILDRYESQQDFEEKSNFDKCDKTLFSKKVKLEAQLEQLSTELEIELANWNIDFFNLQRELDKQFEERANSSEEALKLEVAFQKVLDDKQEHRQEIIDHYNEQIGGIKKILVETFTAEQNENLASIVSLGKRTHHNKALRPLSFATVFVYLRNHGLVGEDQSEIGYSNMSKYFDVQRIQKDEYGEPIYAPLTEMGALHVLIAMDYVRINYEALDEGNLPHLASYVDRCKILYRNVLMQDYAHYPLLEREKKIAEDFSQRLRRLKDEKNGEIEALREHYRNQDAQKDLAYQDLCNRQEEEGRILEESLDSNDVNFSAIVQEFEQKCQNEIDRFDEEYCQKQLLSIEEEIEKLHKNYEERLKFLQLQKLNPQTMLFADIIGCLKKSGLVKDYDSENKLYPGMEGYFDLTTAVRDDEGVIVHADFLTHMENEIGMYRFIQDMGFIVGTRQDEKSEFFSQVASSSL